MIFNIMDRIWYSILGNSISHDNNVVMIHTNKQQQNKNRYYNLSLVLISCLGLSWVICSIILLTTSTTLKIEPSSSLFQHHRMSFDGGSKNHNLTEDKKDPLSPIQLPPNNKNTLRKSNSDKNLQKLHVPSYNKSNYFSRLPLDKTPSLIGAMKGKISCDINVNELAYWNDPQGKIDVDFKTPFSNPFSSTKYITFEPDRGGWNNIRMSMEIMFVIAVATNRTLVLPPDQPLYLLDVSVITAYLMCFA